MSETETLELARELIARASITPADAGCLDVLGARLDALGFECRRLPAGDVENLWAIKGAGGPVFAFAGHTDVVPPGDEASWSSPPFAPVVRNGLLYGRGAADMKGSLAAMIIATERFLAAHPGQPGRIAFLLTSDEEGAAVDGTIRIMEHLASEKISLDYCVVGEPSSTERLGDTVRVGRRGSLNGRLLVHGVQGHVAYPERADNPVHRSLAALAELAARTWDAGNAYYPPTSFQISNIHAGTGAENVIPQDLEVLCNFRYSTESSADSLRDAVGAMLARHGLRYDIDWRVSGEPFLTPGGRLVDTVLAVVEEELGIRPECSTGGGTSDGRFIAPSGAELVELGPVNATIHKVNECVEVQDLERLARVYERILEELLTR